jgi:two-component system, LytTR family, response regulator LytT
VELENAGNAILSLTSLKALEAKLAPERFMRIHRSFIISLDKVTSMTKNSVYIGKKMITVGDQYRDAFDRFVAQWT